MDLPVVFQPPNATLKGTKGKPGLVVPPPYSISDINNSSDWQQVTGLYNRRIAQVYQTPPTAIVYASAGAGNWPTAAFVNDLRTKIKNLRTDFGTDVHTGQDIIAQDLIDIRNALGFTSTATYARINLYTWVEADKPWNTPTIFTPSSALIGQREDSIDPSVINRGRFGTSFNIFNNIIHTVTGSIGFTMSSFTLSGAGTITAQTWASNTDDHLAAPGWQSHLDNLCDTLVIPPVGNVFRTMNIPSAVLAARSGNVMSLIMGEHDELINVRNLNDPEFTFQGISNPYPFLTLNFGF